MSTAIGSGPSLGERYRLVRTLKVGHGVRTVLAVDAETGGQVVLKIVEQPMMSPEARVHLEHEAAVLRGLKSPWLAPLLHVADDPDRLYLVMPYVPGTTLQERLATGPLPVGETIAIMRCLLGALAELHDHGVIHGDVKPGNVVLDGTEAMERAVLIDFGYAQRAVLATRYPEQQAEAARYMSPEQAGLIGREVDERTDLYSLGILTFECLAGGPPFDADDVGQLLRQHLSAQPPTLRGFGLVPRSLDEVVQRMLQKDPDDRYQSARAVLADLDVFAAAMERGVSEPQIVVGAHDRRQTLTEPNLTGREAELAFLSQNLEAAKFGQGRLVMVEAESGGGKTRLLDEFCQQAAGETVWVLRGQGVDRAAARPLQVLAGLAAEVLAATRASAQLAADLRERLGDHRQPLCRVLPELGEVLQVPDQPEGLEAYGQAHGVESLVALLDALGSPGRPALVVLDDCQWIDELSVRVLLAWFHREPAPDSSGPNVLIVVAARQEELTDDHALKGLSGVSRLELPPLSRNQIRQVVESMAGQMPSAALDVIVQLSGGSPFMVLAVLRGLVESGALSPTEEGWHFEPLSTGVRASRQAAAFLARRLELLDPVAHRLLACGAVLGREFDLRLASVLAGQRDAESEAAVSQALQRQLVWQGAGQRFTFVHDRLREAFLESLDSEGLTRLHRRAGEEIEIGNPSRVFELSYHFDAGGQPDRALPYAVRSAESARIRNDLELAERQYRIAERGAVHAEPAAQQRVAAGLGEVLMLRGRYDEAGQRLERALALAQDKVSSARIQGELGELAFKHDDIDGAVVSIEQALRMLDETVPRRAASFALLIGWELAVRVLGALRPARRRRAPADDAGDARNLLAAHLYARLLYAWYFSKRGTLATVWVLLRQVNAAERCPSSRQLAQAYGLYGGGLASTCPVFWKRALRYVDRARDVHQQLGDPQGERHALSRALVLSAAGRFSDGEEAAAQAMRFLQRSGDLWELYWAAFHRSLCLYRMGDFPAAIEQARSTHQAAAALGDRQAAATTLEIWAKASGGLLPPEPITAALREAGVDIQTASALLQAQAVHLRAQGRRDEAIRYAEEAVTLPRRLRTMNMYLVPALPLVTTLYREAAEESSLPGPRRRLLRRAARAGRRARRYAVVYRNELPHALREQAMIAALRGRSRRARRLFKASLGQAEQRGARAEMAETLQLRARVGGQLGWPGSAADQTRCDELFEEIIPGGPAARREPTLGLAERFDALLAAGGPLVSAGSSEEIAMAVEEAVMVLLRPERCRVVGIGPGRHANLDEERENRSMSGTRLVQRAMEERRPVVLSGLDDDDQSDSIPLAGARSALCAPIVVGNESLGYLLAWHSRVTGLFGDEEQRLAQFIAHLAGAALEREGLQQRMRAGVVAAQEAERARVARDLHDEIGQALTSVLLGVRLVQTSLGAEPLDREHLLERTDEVRQVATDALGEVQRLAFELRPTVLDDLGLIPALRRLVGEISSRHGITVDLVVSHLAPGDRLAPDVETTAYRVVQEALTNVVRHAQASTCSVLLARVQNRLRLVVEDNGIGYEVTQTREGSLGLRGISERAALVGGIVRITSSPGEGTVVAMEVPVG